MIFSNNGKEVQDHGPVEITTFRKRGGPLTKRISLDAEGKVIADGSQCLMAHGTANRVALPDLQTFADLIAGMPSKGALALGALAHGRPDRVEVVTKSAMNGSAGSRDVIARTGNDITFRPGE